MLFTWALHRSVIPQLFRCVTSFTLFFDRQVVARDRDQGFAGALVYAISSGDVDCVFDVNSNTGELRVAAPLDRETTPEYTLNITAYDRGQPPKSASRLVRVVLVDVNDNAPKFVKSSFSFFFPENTMRGTTVVALNATDPDAGANGRVTYSLDTDTADFALDTTTGLLSVARPLDREAVEYYDLRVRAVDGSPDAPMSSVAAVRVRVLDVNDVPPVFSADEHLVRAREDFPVGTVVGSVDATDPDLYQGGRVRFSLVAADGGSNELVRDSSHHFAIDPASGAVRIISPLDYESQQLFNLTVKATDEGSPPLSSTCSFLIEVVDVNENLHAPRFKSFFERAAVPENLPAGSHVATVTATDADGPDSDDGRVDYAIRGGDGLGTFVIDDDGAIRTLAALDRESKANYWLVVHATDRGAAPLSAKMYVYVEVLDVNDNAPLTEKPAYYPSVAENSPPFTVVLQLKAVDGDDLHGQRSQLTYEIVGGNPQSLFHVDPHSGLLSTTKRRLDRETQASHSLDVRVSDGGQPPLNSTTRVVITVTDQNDNSPEFLER
jgi:protocadherin Fat 1/2/3